MSNEIKETRKNQSPFKIPYCPYKHRSCLHYDPILRQGDCQPHVNRHHKSTRCRWLPSWVPDGWHVAVLHGAHLSARRAHGGR